MKFPAITALCAAPIVISRSSAGGNCNINVAVEQSTSVTKVIIWIIQEVIVGGADGLVYTPDQVNAAVRDMVIFEFHSNNHTAPQSTFTTPCDTFSGGMDSGFMANINNSISPVPQFALQVTATTPIHL
ncbi:hypothetical protein JHW43_004364 [Diplocarpon mali]|nr:hypothetical protein JHW43_004364 [Diplocarpon mali]